MGNMGNAYKMFVGEPEKSRIGRHGRGWKDNVIID
jgi:hypothetical protein